MRAWTPAAGMLGCALLLCTGCGDDGDGRGPLPDWTDGYDRGGGASDAGLPPTDAGLDAGNPVQSDFELRARPGLEYPTRIHREGTDAPGCRMRPGQEGSVAQTLCILEINELDLHVEGVQLELIAPEDSCEFVHLSGFMYANFSVGRGPTVVSYSFDETSETYSDEMNSDEGEPVCPFDHRDADGPNCCEGSYTLQRTTTLRDGGVDMDEEEADWNSGSVSDCYAGAAFLAKDVTFADNGFPLDQIYFVSRDAQIIELQYGGISALSSTNLPLANHWIAENYTSGLPAPMRDSRAEPYYEYACLDHAGEILAQIRLQVREWNQEAEYDVDGDPDTTGREPDRWGGWVPINDLGDFTDLAPDDDTFPSIRERNH